MTQQELAKLIIDSITIWTVALFALIGVLSPLVGLVTSALIAGKYISADGKWAQFAAKMFSGTLQAQSSSTNVKQVASVDAAIAAQKGETK
jgi:hypothetical protein